MHDPSSKQGSGNPEFATTQWQIVRDVADSDSGVRKSALGTLCEIYWYPLYAYVRRLGHGADQAADLTQAFFADLLERGDLENISPDLGRFRSFLLVAIRNFISNQRKREQAAKRGGGKKTFSFNFVAADERFSDEPGHDQTAEKAFEREWAMTLLQRAQVLLEKEWESKGRKHQFEVLKGHLSGKNEHQTLAESAARLGMSEVATKVAVHRMRERFGGLLRQEIRSTLDSETEVDAEIRHLFSVLRG